MFLTLGMRTLKLLPPLGLAVVAGLPLTPAAGGQEHANEQAEQEDQSVDDQDVRIGREGHVASPTKLDTRRLRLSAPPRSILSESGRAGTSGDYLPWRKLSLIEQLAGPRMTTNRVGRMNRISGTVMIAGRRAAFSSARIMRWWRNSAERTRNALASGVPYFSVWIMVVTTPRTASRSTRLARFSNACRRSFKKPSSMAVSPNSSPSSG